MSPQEHQQLLDEMYQDLLLEAKADDEYEHKMRTDIDYALNTLEKNYNLIECIANIKGAIKHLNDLGYDISIEELTDLY